VIPAPEGDIYRAPALVSISLLAVIDCQDVDMVCRAAEGGFAGRVPPNQPQGLPEPLRKSFYEWRKRGTGRARYMPARITEKAVM